jgi:hypothetical protein
MPVFNGVTTMEFFKLLFFIWGITIIPFLVLLGINLVRIWMQGHRHEMGGSLRLR